MVEDLPENLSVEAITISGIEDSTSEISFTCNDSFQRFSFNGSNGSEYNIIVYNMNILIFIILYNNIYII